MELEKSRPELPLCLNGYEERVLQRHAPLGGRDKRVAKKGKKKVRGGVERDIGIRFNQTRLVTMEYQAAMRVISERRRKTSQEDLKPRTR